MVLWFYDSVISKWRKKQQSLLLLPPPLCRCHNRCSPPSAQQPKDRSERPSSLHNPCNCLWHCLSSAIIQLCPVTPAALIRVITPAPGRRKWEVGRRGEAIMELTGQEECSVVMDLAIIWSEWKHPSYWIDLSLRVMDLPVYHFLLHCWLFQGDSCW